MPAVTRKGDKDVTHCSTPVREQHSPNVYVNNIAVSRQGDNNTSTSLTMNEEAPFDNKDLLEAAG